MNPEAQDIRDIKGMVEIPAPPNYWLWAAIAILLLVGAFLLWKWLTRKPVQPGISAAKEAFAKLKKAERLIDDESAEPLVVAATDALRHYIEARFSLAAPRRTTEEFLRDLPRSGEGEILSYRDELETFLRSCDDVKFGGAEMEVDARRGLLETARRFIEATRLAPEEESKPSPAGTLSGLTRKLALKKR